MSYITIDDNMIDGYPIITYPDIGAEHSFLNGHLLDEHFYNDEPLLFEVECPSDEYPGHFHNGVIPVFSKEFVEAIKFAGIDNFQLFPAVLLNRKENAKWNNYYAFNAIGVIDAANKNESIFHVIMPGGENIPTLGDYEKIVLDPNKTTGRLMFREVTDQTLLFFDERLKDALASKRPQSGWGIALKRYESISS